MAIRGCLRTGFELFVAALFGFVALQAWLDRDAVADPRLRPVAALFAILLGLTGTLPLLASRAPRLLRAVAGLWFLGFVALVVVALLGR